MLKSFLSVAVLFMSITSYAAKPEDAGVKGAENKASAEVERLCRQGIVDQLKALEKKQGGKANQEAIKALSEQLKACRA